MKLKYKLENYLWSIKNKIEDKFFKWGYDKEGDLALYAFGILFVLYKWSSPVITFDTKGFVPLTDSNSKDVWKKARNSIVISKEKLNEYRRIRSV